MSTGDCFHCHQPGHWAKNCPLKTTTKPTTATAAATSPPLIHCPCNAGPCEILTSKTAKNPKRRFYTCPSCGFFKWCDQVSIKSKPISLLPTCPCGAGPCKRVTVINGPNTQRSYFVCCLKKSFGACGFFKWEDDDESLLHETELDSDGNVKRSSLGVGVESELNPTSSSESTTTLGNRVVDGIVKRSRLGVVVESELNPTSSCESTYTLGNRVVDGNVKRSSLGTVVESELNLTSSSDSTTLGNRVVDGNVKRNSLGVVVESELKPTSSSESTTTLGNRVVDGFVKRSRLGVGVDSELDPTSSSESTTLVNRVVDGFVNAESIPIFAGFDKESGSNSIFASADGIVPSFDFITIYEDAVRPESEEQVGAPNHLEPQAEALCSDQPRNGKDSYASEGVVGLSQNTSEQIHQRATTYGETEDSFSGSSSLMELIEQYNSEKLYFENVSMKHVDALTAYTSSYKQLESIRDIAHSLKKQLLEVEKQVKLYEAETSEFAASLEEVSCEMAKSQKKMVETAGKVAKGMRVIKQRD